MGHKWSSASTPDGSVTERARMKADGETPAPQPASRPEPPPEPETPETPAAVEGDASDAGTDDQMSLVDDDPTDD